MDREIALALEILRQGGIILYPTDTVWGIGLEADHPDATNPAKWKGQNLLGKILMRVRKELREKYKEE